MSYRLRTAACALIAFGALVPASAFAQSKAPASAPASGSPKAGSATDAASDDGSSPVTRPAGGKADNWSKSPDGKVEKKSLDGKTIAKGTAASSQTQIRNTGSETGEVATGPNGEQMTIERGDRWENKWVGWNTGGPEATYGLGAFAHLGVGHRFNHSPVPDAGANSGASPNGLLIGIDAIFRFNRYFGVGLGYEHADLGRDQLDDTTQFSDIRRAVNNLWIQARVYPLRVDPFALYIDFAGGPSWQNVDTSTTKLDDVGNVTPGTKCGGNSKAGLGLRGGVGGELSLLSGLTFFGEIGPDGYLLSEKDLDGCGPGSGNAINIAFRAGFAFGLEKTKRHVQPGDADKDTITDDKDACPTVPGIANVDPAKNGCPAAKDRDLDGVPDETDACPETPGVASADPTKNGCPIPKDRDNDGITDDVDACPDTAGPKSEDPTMSGCPDKDGDLVVDKVDACPDVPGVKTADPKTNGCPGDTDGDGITDDKDACPKEPGKADPDPAKNGCPQVVVRDNEIVINEQVQFDTDRATIKKASDGLLDNVAKAIKDHPEILKIEVQGHTDNTGAKAHNQQLSKARADAVSKALIKRGVEASRLTSQGYGQDQPIATNDTDDGRTKNRRVQFKITDKKPAAAPGAMPEPAPQGAPPAAPKQ